MSAAEKLNLGRYFGVLGFFMILDSLWLKQRLLPSIKQRLRKQGKGRKYHLQE